ncbi:MAG: hypothetical protein M3452_08960 [Chloroflexota bacterium]|nr:hypothetical protein [Chloroflexota bacterium]
MPLLSSAPVARIVRITAAVVFLIGVAAVLGWIAGLDALKSIVPGTVEMKINTGICLAASGLALWSLGGVASPTDGRRRVGFASLGAVAVIAGLTLVQYIAQVDLGIDQLLAYEGPGEFGTTIPGRMSPQTAMSLLAIGAALALATAGRGRNVVVVLALVPLVLGVLNGMDLLYGASAPHVPGRIHPDGHSHRRGLHRHGHRHGGDAA